MNDQGYVQTSSAKDNLTASSAAAAKEVRVVIVRYPLR